MPKISSQTESCSVPGNRFLAVPATLIVEQLVEVPKTVSQDRIQQRTLQQIPDTPGPQVVEELVEVFTHFSQDAHQQRFAEQIFEVPNFTQSSAALLRVSSCDPSCCTKVTERRISEGAKNPKNVIPLSILMRCAIIVTHVPAPVKRDYQEVFRTTLCVSVFVCLFLSLNSGDASASDSGSGNSSEWVNTPTVRPTAPEGCRDDTGAVQGGEHADRCRTSRSSRRLLRSHTL